MSHNLSRIVAPTALAITFVGFILAASQFGCGGSAGSGRNGGVSPARVGNSVPAATGRASLSVNWPAPSTGRLIPFAANSIKVRITRANSVQVLGEGLLVRPSGGGLASLTLDRLPIGDAVVTATAYPGADGTGVAQAQAQVPVTIIKDQIVPVRLTLASTIASVEVSPSLSNVTIGASPRLVATPRDGAGNAVLVTPSTLHWSSSAPPVAAVDGAGQVTATATGTATITATETESGKSGTATVTVSSSPTPTPTPTPTATPTPTPTPTVSPAASIAFRTPQAYAAPGAAEMVAADFDGDGSPDVAVGSQNSVLVFYGRSDGTLENARTVYTGVDGAGPAAVADLDGDGKLDIICLDRLDKVRVLFNAGGGAFDMQFVNLGQRPGGIAAAADFDGDGDPDLAVMLPGNGPGGSVTIIRNDGNRTLTRTDSYGVPGIAFDAAAGRLDAGATMDLVVSFGTSTVGQSGFLVLLGNGQGKFTSGVRYNTGTSGVVRPALADFNKDGKLDIAVNNYWDHNAAVLFGNGDGTFRDKTHYTAEPYPHGSRTADFNTDGWPDLVIANAGSDHLSVLRNLRTGNGQFADRQQLLSGGSNTRTCAVADFNRDGKPDIVSGCESSGNITVRINSSQ